MFTKRTSHYKDDISPGFSRGGSRRTVARGRGARLAAAALTAGALAGAMALALAAPAGASR
jgi:hypothetical protein